jgi:hypothetical protein
MEKDKEKTPIFCSGCQKNSGYFIEEFIYEIVNEIKYCKNCKTIVLDKPDFQKPLYN